MGKNTKKLELQTGAIYIGSAGDAPALGSPVHIFLITANKFSTIQYMHLPHFSSNIFSLPRHEWTRYSKYWTYVGNYYENNLYRIIIDAYAGKKALNDEED